MVQLQKAGERFRKEGYGLAAVTYDNAAILKEFSEQYHIEYSLLADPESEVIKRFGLLDPDESPNNLPDFAKKGMALPGFFLLSKDGTVKEKYFGEIYYDRYTANNVLRRMFPEIEPIPGERVTAPNLGVTSVQSDVDVVTGNRVTFAVEIDVPKGSHLYAPGVKNYRPVQLVIDSLGAGPLRPKLLKKAHYPPAQEKFLKILKETVPIYEGKVVVGQDVMIVPPKEIQQKLGDPEAKPGFSVPVTVFGRLSYQVCDAKTCFLPAEVPIRWVVQVHPINLNRASESIQDRRN